MDTIDPPMSKMQLKRLTVARWQKQNMPSGTTVEVFSRQAKSGVEWLLPQSSVVLKPDGTIEKVK